MVHLSIWRLNPEHNIPPVSISFFGFISTDAVQTNFCIFQNTDLGLYLVCTDYTDKIQTNFCEISSSDQSLYSFKTESDLSLCTFCTSTDGG